MNQMHERLNILIVDDHPLFRKGVCSLFNEFYNVSIIDEAANGLEALKMLDKNHYDIVFMDIEMPKLNGVETSRHIVRKHPKTKIIILSLYDSIRYVNELLGIGVHGYMLKSINKEEVHTAVKTVLNNVVYLTPSIKSLWDEYNSQKNKNTHKNAHISVELTHREVQIIEEICEQKSSNEIAEKLCISKATVDNHRQSIMKKLKADNVVAIILYAIRNGIYKIKKKNPLR